MWGGDGVEGGHALEEAIEHGFDRGEAADICVGILGELGAEGIVFEEEDDFFLEGGEMIFGDDEAIAAIGEVMDFWGLEAIFGDHGEAPEEGLVEAEADIAGDDEEIGGFEDFANEEILGVEDFAEVTDIGGVDEGGEIVRHLVADDDEAVVWVVDFLEDLDEVFDLFDGAHASDEEDDFFEGEMEFGFEGFFGGGDFGEGGKIDGVWGDESFGAIGGLDVFEFVWGVEEEGIDAVMDVVEGEIADEGVTDFEIDAFVPVDHGDALVIEPMEEGPDEEIFEVEEEDDDGGLEALDFFFVGGEGEGDFLEIERDGEGVIGLEMIGANGEGESFFGEAFGEVIVIGDAIMEDLIGDEEDEGRFGGGVWVSGVASLQVGLGHW